MSEKFITAHDSQRVSSELINSLVKQELDRIAADNEVKMREVNAEMELLKYHSERYWKRKVAAAKRRYAIQKETVFTRIGSRILGVVGLCIVLIDTARGRG